jgi:hypothetical protein
MAPTCRRIGSNLSNMSVRVVARIRPLLKSESEVDTIVTTAGADEKARPNVVKVPNPKNFSEQFSFQFNSVYGEDTTQQEIFDAEGELGLSLKLIMVLKMRCSCAHRQASVSWVRCHPLRLWSYFDRKDTHYARREVAYRPRHYSSISK